MEFKIPRGFFEAVSIRHNGNSDRSDEEILTAWDRMQGLYDDWRKWNDKENYLLNVEWDEKQIEKYYMERIWKNAHRRLRSYRKKSLNAWRKMFNLLVAFDGLRETFNEGVSIRPEEIYHDFKRKYMKRSQIEKIEKGDQ